MTGSRLRPGLVLFGPGSVLLVSFLVLILCVSPLWALQDHETQCKEAVKRADWAKVGETVRAWEQADAGAVVADWLLGYAGLGTGDYKTAAGRFSRLSQPQTLASLLSWAETLAERSPDNAITQMLLGDALARSGRYEDALAALDKAVRLESHSALVRDVRGAVRALAGRPDEASVDFEQAVELDPDFLDPLVNLGVLRLTDDDLLGALEYLDLAISACSDFGTAYNVRGVVYANLKAWGQAETDLREAEELSPSLSFVTGNLNVMAWMKGQEEFVASRASDDTGDSRGTTFLRSAYDRYSVAIGDGRAIDVINIKNTPQTATLAGVEATFRLITDDLRNEGRLPPDWKPNVLLAQPGLGSSAYAERRNLAKMAFQSGKDFVVCVDMTDRFQWPEQSHDLRALEIGEDVSRRFERAVVAANHVWEKAPTAVLESQASRMLLNGELGSVTVADLFVRQSLHPDFKLDKTVVVGMPLPRQTVNDAFQKSCLGNLMAITTRSMTGLVASEPLANAPAVQIWTQDRRPPSHGALFADRWSGNRPNPIPELIGLHMRGEAVSSIQDRANELRDKVPMYTSSRGDPATVHLTMSSMTRRGLSDSHYDAVLIGCADHELGEMMKAQFGDAWRVKIVPEADPMKLQQVAHNEGFTRILRVADSAVPDMQPPRVGFDGSRPMTLPEVRSLAKNIDRFNTAVGLLYKLADSEMPPEMKLPLGFAAPVIQDLKTARERQYSFATSQTMERIGRFGLKELPKVVQMLKDQGKLSQSFNVPSPIMAGLPDVFAGAGAQVGRGKWTPSIPEITCYLDGVNKACWATVGEMVSGPKGAQIASMAGGLAADIGRDLTQPIFDRWANTPVRRQMIQDYRSLVDVSIAHGVAPRTFSEVFTPKLAKQVGFSQRAIAELDGVARARNTLLSGETGISPARELQTIDPPVIINMQYDDLRKRLIPGPFPPNKFGGAGIPPTNYRLPSNALPDDKRGGVAMAAKVEKKERADTSELFGGATSTQPTATQQDRLLCPFLLFCAVLEGE